jgi:uncharacterized protein YjbI with pentapeptide repeats
MSPKMIFTMFAVFFLSFSTCFAHANYDTDDEKKFDKTNSCSNCNLSNASIYGSHQHAYLEGANISNASLQGDYTRADFSNVLGVKAYLHDASEAKFINGVFIEARFNGNFTNADFTNANLHGADMSNTNLYGARISTQQLIDVKSLCDAILPDGRKGMCR